LSSQERRPLFLLLAASTLVAVHRPFGSIEFARSVIGIHGDPYPAIYMFLTAFLLFGLVPFVLIVLSKGSPAECGVQLGDWKFGLKAVAILLPLIVVLFLMPASHDSQIRHTYPLDPSVGSSLWQFLVFQSLRGLLYYGAWEFFFRGVMLFGLEDRFGRWAAIAIQTIPSSLWHIGFPTGELITSIPGGILFGLLAFRTRSILWPFLLHFMIAVILDLLIIFS
jgi:membrane protease YdiL (CAAX protease family)